MSTARQEVDADTQVASTMMRLARDASLELNGLDAKEFDAARSCLWPGQRVFVSHLPGQTWATTLQLCAQVSAAGCEAVPHIPVRLLEHARELDEVLAAARTSGVGEMLLISGDYARPRGPYADVMAVLRTGRLRAHGFERVSIAGHPEGHPAVPADDIRQAQIDKARYAASLGLRVSIVTQFFFEVPPFLDWAAGLRRAGVEARLVAGIAGPTGITKLLGLARRCGVGPSVRALTARPSSMLKLMVEQDPAGLLRALAPGASPGAALVDGIHLFSFGGFRRTAQWAHDLAARRGAG